MLSYRIPSIPVLFMMDMSMFDTYTVLTFDIVVKMPVEGQDEMQELKCGNSAKCRVQYKKSVTP